MEGFANGYCGLNLKVQPVLVALLLAGNASEYGNVPAQTSPQHWVWVFIFLGWLVTGSGRCHFPRITLPGVEGPC